MIDQNQHINPSAQCEEEFINEVHLNHKHAATKSLSPDEILNDPLENQALAEQEAIVVIDDAIVRALPWTGDKIIH